MASLDGGMGGNLASFASLDGLSVASFANVNVWYRLAEHVGLAKLGKLIDACARVNRKLDQPHHFDVPIAAEFSIGSKREHMAQLCAGKRLLVTVWLAIRLNPSGGIVFSVSRDSR